MESARSTIKSAIDILCSPLALLGALASLPVARWTGRLPVSSAIFDRFGVYLIRHHYYTPLVYRSDLRTPLARERVITGLDLNEVGQLALLASFDYQAELMAIPDTPPSPFTFGYANAAFGPGDAEYFYNMIRYFKPARLLEIGCGQSTLLAQRAIGAGKSQDPAYDCRHICVEPFEQPWLDRLDLDVIRQKIEDLDPSIVETLDANDILFIDSSHMIRPQGDVLSEYLDLIGRVRPGVIIHVHDVFTPRDYPEEWVVRDRRLWNEQYLLEAFLCFNQSFKVIGALNWLWHNHRQSLARACPVLAEKGGEPGSFWFTRVA